MPSLVCHHLHFHWPTGEVVFSGLDATFPDGLTGLVGLNGSGKTTLLRLLIGELIPAGGTVSGADLVGYLPQQLTLAHHLTVAEVLGVAAPLLALRRITEGDGTPEDFATVGDDWDLPERLTAALAQFGFADLALDRPLGTLSGGEAVLLALAGLMLSRPDVLILDEPTNNLDRSARRRLYAALRQWRGPAVVVSHDRQLLDEVDQIAELRDGGIRFFGGNASAFADALAVEQQAAARGVRAAEGDLKRQQRELADMRITLDRRQRYARAQADHVPKIVAGAKKRAAQVSAGKLADRHQADVAAARERLVAAEDAVRDDDLIRIDLRATAIPAGRTVAEFTDLVLRNGVAVSGQLRGPERVAVVGPNGSGKTTFVDTLLGRIPPRSGSATVRVPVRLLPQRLQLLGGDDSVLAAVARRAPAADDNARRAQLARFLLDADTVGRPIRTLSGGERFRATLAALLLGHPPPQLLILDEPTNNLDLDSVAQLGAALRAYAGALLVVSHDEPFLAELGIERVLDFGRVPVQLALNRP